MIGKMRNVTKNVGREEGEKSKKIRFSKIYAYLSHEL